MDDKTKRIRIARKMLAKTQADFAKSLGIGRNKYIKGEREGLSREYIDFLIRMYGMNPVFIEVGEGDVFLSKVSGPVKSEMMEETKDIAMNAMARQIKEQELLIMRLEREVAELKAQVGIREQK